MFEVVPVGVTAIAIGVVQSLWLIRDPRTAMTDFMDPSVWFIFGSLLIGAAFAKTGLTRRVAFLMLTQMSESTRIIYLGVFAMTATLTLFMAHTAVAAAVFPLLLVIHNLYEPTGRPHALRQGAVHRHGLDRRRRQHHHPAGRRPRRRGARLLPGTDRRGRSPSSS